MQYISGYSLEKRLSMDQPITWYDRLKWASQIASAMYYIHSMDIIHRDLRCCNVLVSCFSINYTVNHNGSWILKKMHSLVTLVQFHSLSQNYCQETCLNSRNSEFELTKSEFKHNPNSVNKQINSVVLVVILCRNCNDEAKSNRHCK